MVTYACHLIASEDAIFNEHRENVLKLKHWTEGSWLDFSSWLTWRVQCSLLVSASRITNAANRRKCHLYIHIYFMWWNNFLSKKPCQQLLAFLSLLLALCLRHLLGHLRGKSEESVNSVTSTELTQSCSHRTNSENVAFNHAVWRWRSDLREGELISVRPSTINNFNGNGTEFGVLWKIIPHTSLKQMHLLLGRKRSRQWGYSSRTRFGWLHVPIILLSLGNTSKLGKHLFIFLWLR